MNILIIDDHEEMFDGIQKRVLHTFPNAQCHFASKMRDALFILRSKPIDLLISDLEFKHDPVNDGWRLLRKAVQLKPSIKAIAYTSHGSYQIMKESIETGFLSFLEKGCSLIEFEQTLKGVISNGAFDSKTMSTLKKKRYAILENKFRDSMEAMKELSQREVEVAILLAETLNKHLIADTISQDTSEVKASTVDTYIKRIMQKLMIHNRTDLSLFCAEFIDQLKKLRGNKR